jgi:hypothetical protein
MAYSGDWGDNPVWANLQNFMTTYETTSFHTRSPLPVSDCNDFSFYVVTKMQIIVLG